MNIFDHNYFLGYINAVTAQYINIHFPSAKLLQNFHYNGIRFRGGNVGNYIIIEGNEYGFLGRIIEISLPDSERKSLNESVIQHDETEFHPSGKAEIMLSFEIFNPTQVKKTISSYPCIGAKVYSCSDQLISYYVYKFGAKLEREDPNIKLGRLLTNNVECIVSLNALLGRHCAIVGTTGGGKSWTLAHLIEAYSQRTENKVVLIDATGEYENLPSKSITFGSDCYFGYYNLKNSDFCFLLQEHSPNTTGALCNAINSLKIKLLSKNEFDGIKSGKNIIDVENIINKYSSKLLDADFNVDELINQIRNECVKENFRGNYEADSFKLGYCSHLITRVSLLLNNDIIRKSFGLNKTKEIRDINEIIDEFIESSTDSVLRINFGKLPFDFNIREIVVDFISRNLLQKAKNENFRKNPILFCIDEAHQFLNKSIIAEDNSILAISSVNNIAKEGRKYGLFLCIATQMPRDIPMGILSQMGSFIVHRLINDLDKRSVEQACSSANRTTMSFLPVLGAGEAILTGVDFPMPLMLKISSPYNKPNSQTPVFSKVSL